MVCCLLFALGAVVFGSNTYDGFQAHYQGIGGTLILKFLVGHLMGSGIVVINVMLM